MARSIVGVFADRSSAERAVEDLKAAGFDPARIGVVMQDKGAAQEVATEHGTAAGQGAVAGGLFGGALGAILAATGALVVPGIGPVIAGGILATAIAGAAVGGLVGALVGLGIPKEEAEYYQGRVQQGSVLVTVDAQGRDGEARQILLRDGAEDLRAQGFGGGYETAAGTATATTAATATATTAEDVRVPVREEELVAGKRQNEIGQVHIHKDVVEEQQTVNVPLQQERVTVERVPVSGEVSAADATDAFTERDIDVPVKGEEAVVDKRATVKEEVRLHKDAVTKPQQVSDTVRKERVTVEGADEVATDDRTRTP